MRPNPRSVPATPTIDMVSAGYNLPTATPDATRPSVYLHSSRWDELLIPDEDGLPPLRFTDYRNAYWFAERTTGLLVNVGNRHLRRLGIWSATVRGAQYHAPAKLGPATLEREPDNEHDPAAVAVISGGLKVGYFNKQMAKSLAKALDAGEELEAVIVSEAPVKIVAAAPRIMAHLRGNS